MYASVSPIQIAVAIVSLLLLIAGVVLVFLPKRWAPAPAFAGMLGITHVTSYGDVSSLIFWGVAAAIAIALGYMLPGPVATSRRGLGYIAGAALAGGFVGIAISPSWVVAGVIAGAILGAIAYAKTPHGKALGFPSSKFLNYLCAKGLPAVVTIAIACTAALWI